MKVCAVIVTYGNRFRYVEKVIRALISEKIDRIILVSNGTIGKSYDQLITLKSKHNIEIVSLKKNMGSAYGFKIGIQKALENKDNEFIWLLDDDNQPEVGALETLKEYWTKCIENTDKSKTHALLSYRNDRPLYKEAVIKEQPYLMLGHRNSFLGFHVLEVFKRVYRKLFPPRINHSETASLGKVAVAPYGGLFFHRNLILSIGLPDESYFLYADDYDFSYRITKREGDIILITKSKINDLETSFHLKHDNDKSSRYFKTDSKFRIYYSVRNGIRFESENFVSNKFIYKLNMVLYLILLFLLFCTKPNQFKKFTIIISAIIAAFKKDFSEI